MRLIFFCCRVRCFRIFQHLISIDIILCSYFKIRGSEHMVHVGHRFEPIPEETEFYEEKYGRFLKMWEPRPGRRVSI